MEETFKFIKDIFPTELENRVRSDIEGGYTGRNYFSIFIRCFVECLESSVLEIEAGLRVGLQNNKLERITFGNISRLIKVLIQSVKKNN